MGVLDELTKDRKRIVVAALLIILFASALRFYHIQWSFSNNGIDEGIMLERSLMVDEGYRLYSELPCDQPPLAFYLGAVLGGDVLSLRIMVAGMSILAIAACMFVSKRQKGPEAMLFTGLLLSIDFVFLRESRLFSLDAMSACFIAFSILAFAFYVNKNSKSALALAGLLAGLSTASKLLGGLAIIGMLLFMVLESRRDRRSLPKLSVDVLVMIVSAAAPLLLFMAFLGPREVLDGMILQQGQRGFDAFLKLSIVAFFGLNIAYVLPLARARYLWRGSKLARFLLCLVAVMLAFMVLQPLVFVHHLAVLSPPLAILSGIVVADMLMANKRDIKNIDKSNMSQKKSWSPNAALALLTVTFVVCAGLANYGLSSQTEPIQKTYADWLSGATTEDEFVLSGDPIICAYAHRMTPPDIVNVAYRQHDDLTLDRIVGAIEEYNVSVVIVCYRLNDVDGLTSYLTSSGFVRIIIPGESGSKASLDLFQEGLGPIVAYVRTA
jgi:4-amino-4-deoxy-L-arabinose transferase-like glycosyltransferase